MKKIIYLLVTAALVAVLAGCPNPFKDQFNELAKKKEYFVETEVKPAESLAEYVCENDPVPSKQLPIPSFVKVLGNGEKKSSIGLECDEFVAVQFKDYHLKGFKFYISSDGQQFLPIDATVSSDNKISSAKFLEFLKANPNFGFQDGFSYIVAAKAFYQKKNANGVWSGDETSSVYSPYARLYTLGQPLSVKASMLEFTDRVELSWAPVRGAKFYEVAYIPYENVKENSLSELKFDDMTIIDKKVETGFVHADNLKSGGTAEIGKTYVYAVRAISNSGEEGSKSSLVLGEVRSPSAPAQINAATLNVSKGLYGDSIKLSWAAVAGAVKYQLYYSFDSNEENFKALEVGVVKEPEYTLTAAKLLELAKDIQQTPNLNFIGGLDVYFRVAGVNGFGYKGLLTDLRPNDHKGFMLGRPYLNDVDGDEVLEGLCVTAGDSSHNYVGWESVRGATGYGVLKFSSDTEVVDISSIEDDQWDLLLADDLTYFNNDFLVDKNVDKAYAYYKIFALNEFDSLPDDITAENAEEKEEEIENKLVSVSLSSKLLADEADGVYVKGASIPSIIKIECTPINVPGLFSFRVGQNDAAYLNDVPIYITQAENNLSYSLKKALFEDAFDFSITKYAYYGDEAYSSPMRTSRGVVGSEAIPGANGEISFTDAKLRRNNYQMDLSEEVMKEIFNNSEYVLVDKYYDFDRDGNKGAEMSLEYGFWDREAWKTTLRHLPLNHRVAIASDYKVDFKAKNGIADGKQEYLKEGYPALSYKSFAHFVFFMREAAFNRAWEFLCPEWGWDYTLKGLTALLGTTDKPAVNSGKMHLYLKMKGLGGSGNGSLDEYSDWKGFKVSTKDPLQISVSIGNDGYISGQFIVDSPYYDGYINCNDLQVKEFIYQRGPKSGSIDSCPNGRELKNLDKSVCTGYFFTHLNLNLNRYKQDGGSLNWNDHSIDDIKKYMNYNYNQDYDFESVYYSYY